MSDTSEKGNILAHVFTKSRRDKKNNSEVDLVQSGSQTDVSTSVDSLVGKAKESGSPGVLKKLVSGSRRKWKREDEAQRLVDEEAERGRRVAERGILQDDPPPALLTEESGDTSSQIINESEDESVPVQATPPPLSSHPSHTGYLTSSSPLFHSQTLSVEPSTGQPEFNGVNPRPSTFPVPLDNLATSDIEPASFSNSLRTPTDGSQKRSPSPARRLKEALLPGRHGSSPSPSPERGGGGDLDHTSKEKSEVENKRGSVATRLGSKFPVGKTTTSPASSPERPRTGKPKPINTSVPQTPPPPPPGDPAPIIVNTPPTPTESGAATYFEKNRDRGSSDPTAAISGVVTSPSGNMISHRRIKSGSVSLGPSKLSNITSAPLTPTPENGSTTPNSQGGGFFSSVFSAAQNAASTLSNTIQNSSGTTGSKNKITSTIQELQEPESPEVETLGDKDDLEYQLEEKEPAVKTLGMGDLSLSHLGISEAGSDANTPVTNKFPEETRGRTELKSEEPAVRASTPNGKAGDNEYSTTPEAEDVQSIARPRSFHEALVGGEHTPPNGSVFEGKAGIQRSGSIRSALGNRRKRGSSAATGASSTIGAMITAAHSSVANPNAAGSTPKITGFAVASTKRNRDFHQLFRSVPDDDYLIEDYSCAVQREILAHGRLYVSEGHLCFSSNIFGWVTTLVMSFDEIVSVEKRNTAILFKNGLEISTLHAKHIFASFTSRDATYDLIVGIWKLGHPSLRSSLNGVRLAETGGGDKTETVDAKELQDGQSGSDSDSDEDDEDEDEDVFDEDGEDASGVGQPDGSAADSEAGEKAVPRKMTSATLPNASEKKESTSGGDFPGPATHAPTNCTDGDTHYAKVLADETIAAPLGKIYSLMFGPASITWMANWLTVDQKCLDLTMDGENSKKPLSLDNKVRSYSYIKPLPGSIGPKQTKCLSTETLDSFDLEKAISVTISTQTPDVPSGNVFSVKTKYCLSWGEGNGTRLQMNCAIEWTGKSWLKGPIEKGANEGQVKYAKDIIASLEAAVSSKSSSIAAPGKKGKKGKKPKTSTSVTQQMDGASEVKPKAVDWGLFEPVRPLLSPVLDVLKPLSTGNMMYGLLVGLLVASWFGFGLRSSKSDVGGWSVHTPQRVAAYEEIWRREESELWEWLEERVGMEHLADVAAGEEKLVKGRLSDEKLEAKEIDHAIKVTEERLRVLKDIISKDKVKKEKKEKKSKSPVGRQEDL